MEEERPPDPVGSVTRQEIDPPVTTETDRNVTSENLSDPVVKSSISSDDQNLCVILDDQEDQANLEAANTGDEGMTIHQPELPVTINDNPDDVQEVANASGDLADTTSSTVLPSVEQEVDQKAAIFAMLSGGATHPDADTLNLPISGHATNNVVNNNSGLNVHCDSNKNGTISSEFHSPGGVDDGSVPSSADNTINNHAVVAESDATLLENIQKLENLETNLKADCDSDLEANLEAVTPLSDTVTSSDPPSVANSTSDASEFSSILISSEEVSRASSLTNTPTHSSIVNSKNSGDSLGANSLTLDDNDVLLSQLDAELHTTVSKDTDQSELLKHSNQSELLKQSDQLELDSNQSDPSIHSSQLEPSIAKDCFCIEAPNGIKQMISLEDIPEYQRLNTRNVMLYKQQEQMREEINRLKEEFRERTSELMATRQERDDYDSKLRHLQDKNTDEIYAAQIKGLEMTIAGQQAELKKTKETLAAHDSSAKRAVATLQNELKVQVEKVRRMYEETRKEKEGMTMKYAQAEQKNIELQQKQTKIDQQMKDMLRERETVINRFKVMKADKVKMQEMFDSRAADMAMLRKEVEKNKESLQAADLKIKWHQNRLKAEIDANKETKQKLEDCQRKLNEAKEESEMIRQDCQAMVKKYQESDEIRSNSLEKEVKVKDERLQQQVQERNDQTEAHQAVLRELDSLKKRHKDMFEELKTFRDKVTCLEAERITQEHTLDRFKETLQKQKTENKELHNKIIRLDVVEKELTSTNSQIGTLERRVAELEQVNCDLQIDIEGCSQRESEHLQFSQKVSDKNAQLQSENNLLSQKLTGVQAEQERLADVCSKLQDKLTKLEVELAEEKQMRQEEGQALSAALESKSKAVEELSRAVEEEKDENRTLKRKHNANTKDLMRQLQQSRKRLETQESRVGGPAGPGGPGERDSISIGSRTSSNGSLDTVGTSGGSHGLSIRNQSQDTSPQDDAPPIVEVIEIDKRMLVEKIVRLQKAHARKNEKLEFMEDHINQLVNDIQQKTRIIQHYVMREEAGTLSPESMDRNKAQLSKKGGIMASLYNSQSQDSGMNLDLSLQINHKLQSVLEDTLLKNITFKENLDTLGEEISRLSQENRKLQLDALKQRTS